MTILRQALASMVEVEGEEKTLEMFCSRVAEGANPVQLAKDWGFSWYVMREWLESNDGMQRVELASRCYADGLAWEGLDIARKARMETLPVDKFQAEYFQKSAALMNPQGWGGKKDKNGGGITVVVQRGGVVAIGSTEDKGYPLQVIAPEMETIEGQVVDG